MERAIIASFMIILFNIILVSTFLSVSINTLIKRVKKLEEKVK